MHTPDDIDDPNPPKPTNPMRAFCMWTACSIRDPKAGHMQRELKLGVVGLASHAEDVQKEFHDMIGGDEPLGYAASGRARHPWATRLRTCGTRAVWAKRPRSTGLGTYFTGVGLRHVRRGRLESGGCPGHDRTPRGVKCCIGVGPVEGWSVSFFAGLGGYGSATICSTARCSRTAGPSTRSLSSARGSPASPCDMGLVLSLSQSFSTDAFETQEKAAEFGTLSVSWYF